MSPNRLFLYFRTNLRCLIHAELNLMCAHVPRRRKSRSSEWRETSANLSRPSTALKHSVHFVVNRLWHLPLTRKFDLDVDLKKAAKFLAQKFATGASVTKNAQGLDEIVVQGDVSDEVLELVQSSVGVFKGVPVANVEIVEEKKKKGE